MWFIGLDDTDVLDSPGTGRLARDLAAVLATDWLIHGVVRHQLLVDPRVPCTKNNSSAVILLEGQGDPAALFAQMQTLMLERFTPGSDPGLCVATTVPESITEFGRRAKRKLIDQQEARALAAQEGLLLTGLGGTEGGVIGALAGVGLSAGGEDGRYVELGRCREMKGRQPVAALLAAGIAAVRTEEGEPVHEGWVMVDKLRPARRESRPIAVVTWAEDCWQPVKLD